jgi:hypothetical protein
MRRYPIPYSDLFFKYIMADPWYAKSLFSFLIGEEVTEIIPHPHEHVMKEDRSKRKKKADLRKMIMDYSADIIDAAGREWFLTMEMQRSKTDFLLGRFRRYISVYYRSVDSKGELPSRLHAMFILEHTLSLIDAAISVYKGQLTDFATGATIDGLKEPFVHWMTHDMTIIQGPRLDEIKHLPIYDLLFIFDAQNYTPDPTRPGSVIFKDQEYNMTQKQVFKIMDTIIADDLRLEKMLRAAEEELDNIKKDEKIAKSDQKIDSERRLREAAEQGQAAAEQGQAAAEQGQAAAEQGQAAAEQGQAAAEQGQAAAEQGQAEERRQKEEERREKEAILRLSVLRFYALGLSISEIAITLNVTEEVIIQILANQ